MCRRGFFAGVDDTCLPCFENSICERDDERLGSLNVAEGFWRMDNRSTNLRPCPIAEACSGGRALANGVFANLFCAEGYTGALCGSCAAGYARQEDHSCAECSGISIGVIAGAAVVLLVATALCRIRTCAKWRTSRWLDTHPAANAAVGGAWLTKAKIVLAMIQIIGIFPKIFRLDYPAAYLKFYSSLDVLSLDVAGLLSLGCIYVPPTYHYELLLTTTLPLVFAGILGTLAYAGNRAGSFTAAFVPRFLLLTYAVLPSVSAKVFMTFLCDAAYEDGGYPRRFLRADSRIDCDSNEHQGFQAFAVVMIFVYPVGIPLLYFILLRRVRGDLGPALDATPARVQGDRPAVVDGRPRHQNPRTAHLEFLWGSYRPQFWYWECVESLRRLMLTGILVCWMPDAVSQIAVGLLTTLISVLGCEKARPYARDEDHALAEYAHHAVLVTLLASLLLFASPGDGDADEDAVFGVAVVLASVLVACTAVAQVLADLTPPYVVQWKKIKSEHHGATFGFLLHATLFGSEFDVGASEVVAPLPALSTKVSPALAVPTARPNSDIAKVSDVRGPEKSVGLGPSEQSGDGTLAIALPDGHAHNQGRSPATTQLRVAGHCTEYGFPCFREDKRLCRRDRRVGGGRQQQAARSREDFGRAQGDAVGARPFSGRAETSAVGDISGEGHAPKRDEAGKGEDQRRA